MAMGNKLPHRRGTILSVLAFVAAIGGYGGYVVVRDQPHYNPLYDYQTHVVSSVTDGDTIILDDQTRVRLLGINAPEYSDCYGPESTTALRNLIDGKTVRLEKDLTARDEFGRYLRYVYLDSPDPQTDNILVTHYMVVNGLAIDAPVGPDKRYRQYLVKARESAKSAGTGLWGTCPKYAVDTQQQNDSDPTDPACLIKGNISNEGAGKTYFLPGCGNYGRVKVDRSIGEDYFCSRVEAEQAGFVLSRSCGNNGVE